MKDYIFKESFWPIDLTACVVLGALIGHSIGVESGSGGEVYPERILLMTFIGGVSYILAFVILLLFKQSSGRLPDWFWLGIVGSMIFAFINQGIIFPIVNWNPSRPQPTLEYVGALAPFMIRGFIIGIFLFSALTLLFLIVIRAAAYVMKIVLGGILREHKRD